ncbi:FAD-dependent oxidoreductase [Saccharothrix sp. 6-C]|uniref:FAD/NAD(P)-dependent oxidoreductase n=1 Tax=Saccharothrix sp. 6-C TaxID=2781735 RepID=UPI0019179B15|nr:NAD(P)/FAD-dependent oxidoreductase [Saccharothrix sp. 6-C]QQQ80250.1 FAD-dependent oxidoreductase [Saccharothrix sp. 6-C]
MPDVLVVGGGPAGMAAALAARRHGAEHVVLLEAGDDVGGQYWRHPPARRVDPDEGKWHHGWQRFLDLRSALRRDPRCEVVTNAHVWSVDRRDGAPPLVHALIGEVDGQARVPRTFDPAALVLATGAQERTLPFPGWDLPGVVTAGAAQALAKGDRVAVGRRVLVTGSGPFLLPVVSSLVRIGARVVGVVEAAGAARLARGWGAKPWRLAATGGKAAELAGYLRVLAAHRIPYRVGAAVVAAHGDDRVEAVTVARLTPDWSPVPGTQRRVEVDAVCVGHGFVPRAELAISAGCALGEDGAVEVDDRQRTSVPGVFTAGELTGIGGVDLALAEGLVAGAAAAGGEPAPAALRRRAVFREFATRLAAAHAVGSGGRSWADDATVVCRCEDVTAGALRRAAELTGSKGLRPLKLTTRAGLGLCQGRTCGPAVEDLLTGVLDPGRTAHRPIAVPVRLGELADHDRTGNREDVP